MEICFHKLKSRLASFEAEWKVKVILEFENKRILLVGKNAEATTSAKEALEAETVGKTMCSKKLSYDTPSRGALFHLLTTRKQDDLKQLGKDNNVKVLWTPKKKIELKGMKSKVEEVVRLVSDMEEAFKIKEEDHEWPVMLFPALKEHNYAQLVKIEKQHCVYAWVKPSAYTSSHAGIVARHPLSNGTIIEISNRDILKERVDVIVNAANEQLQHSGGIAHVIATAAGKRFEAECAAWISANGRLPTGDAQLCKPGNLSRLSGIINAVGPIYRAGVQGQDKQLASAVRRCFEIANANGFTSIALPALSTGIYDFPANWAATIIVNQAQNFLEKDATSLKVIKITDKNGSTVNHLVKALRVEMQEDY